MKYKWQIAPPADSPEALASRTALCEALHLHPVLADVLVRRGIRTVQEAKRFFRPQMTELYDPFLMRDMHAAVDRINQALARRERILVFGDYDVDGVTAVALVYRFLEQYTSNIDYYVPDRNDEGYGVSFKSIDFAAETGVHLIIVLDCGIKAVEEVAYAKERGIDFIICDHHVPDPVLPDAVAILNPKREDNTYPYTDLSGCGVGFKLMQAFAESNGIAAASLTPLLDLCAISIAADIVPIMGENRVLAHQGLRQINASPSVGVQAIIEVCGLGDREITFSDIIFKIGPRINASGRIQNGREAVELLVETNYDAAIERAEQINLYNEQRKDLDRQMTEEAIEFTAEIPGIRERKTVVIYNEEWHKGVIGIVASRLTEAYYRPAVVLTRSEGMATGSARSVSGFDVYAAVQSCEDLLENFGGHTYAAGLTMKVEHVAEFAERFERYVAEHISDEQTQPTLEVEAELDFSDLTYGFFTQLRRFAPFGPSNPKPLFCSRKVFDYGTSKVVGRGQEHIKLELLQAGCEKIINGIAFGQSAQARYIKTRQKFDICYAVEENVYRRGEVQLIIEDIQTSES